MPCYFFFLAAMCTPTLNPTKQDGSRAALTISGKVVDPDLLPFGELAAFPRHRLDAPALGERMNVLG